LARAVEEYGKATALKGDHIAAFYNRALAYSDMGQFDRALADFNTVLSFNPRNEYALYGRGLLKQKQDDAPSASVDIEAAKVIDPNIAREYDRPLRNEGPFALIVGKATFCAFDRT
jgi:tetratricopeptide (TPR) repeat protein